MSLWEQLFYNQFFKKNVLISDNTGIHKELSKFGLSISKFNSNELYYKINDHINNKLQIKINYKSFTNKFGMHQIYII